MIAAGPHCAGRHKEGHVQGWLISVLLHGTVALAAIIIVRHVQLTPKDEAFKWNVAMVSPTQQVQSTKSAQAQTPVRSAASTTSVPASSVKRSAQAQSLPAPPRLAQQTTPSVSERTGTPVITEPPPPHSTTPSQSATHTIQPAKSVRDETVAPEASETTSMVKPAEATMAVSEESAALTAPSSIQSTVLEYTTQSEQAPAQTQVATISPTPSNAPTTRDYGWLSETILRRVEDLKRYPASARVDRAEGKVVVKAIIKEDGNLGEVEVFQSSGYPTLDKAAVETMLQAAPFHLPHPLGQPRMTIKIPMSYRLDR